MQDKRYLLTYMHKAHITISKIHTKAVVLIGQTKAGTTTVFNWMTGRPIIGRGTIRPVYCNLNQSDPIISHKYPTTTLTPNVKVDFLQNISLIDMPSFNTINRHYIDVAMPILSMKFVLKHLKQAKFILVFSQTTILNRNYAQLTKTITDFLTFFKQDLLSIQIIKMLKQSMMMVVAGSTYSLKDTLIMLNDVIAITRENQLDRKISLMLQILQEIVASGAVELFKQATDGQMPEEPFDFNHRFKRQDSFYFNFEQATIVAKQQVTNTPLNAQFQKLSSYQNEQVDKQVKWVIQFIYVLRSAFKYFLAAMQANDVSGCNVGQFFTKLQGRVENGDIYEFGLDVSQLSVNYRDKAGKYRRMYWFKKIMTIYNLSQQVYKFESTFIQLNGMQPSFLECIEQIQWYYNAVD